MTVDPTRGPVVVDTGVFAAGPTARSAPLAARYRPLLLGHELIITVQTITELYFGAGKDNWGEARLWQLDQRIAQAVIAPCDDHLARTCAQLRLQCLRHGHPLAPLVSDDTVFLGAPSLQLLTARP